MTNRWPKNCFLIAIDYYRLSSITIDYHRFPYFLGGQNNLTHANRVICAKDGAKVTKHVRGHERNLIIGRKLIESKQLDSK